MNQGGLPVIPSALHRGIHAYCLWVLTASGGYDRRVHDEIRRSDCIIVVDNDFVFIMLTKNLYGRI